MTEWRDIPGYEGHYQASDDGLIKSLARSYVNKSGQTQPIRERILSPGTEVGRTRGNKYATVHLRAPDGKSRRSWKVHQLVARTFHGPPPFPGAEVCHGDGNSLNNRADNLRWDTRAANGVDSVKHGTNRYAARTHCESGHEYTPENTRWVGPTRTRRGCRMCHREYSRQYYLRKQAAA